MKDGSTRRSAGRSQTEPACERAGIDPTCQHARRRSPPLPHPRRRRRMHHLDRRRLRARPRPPHQPLLKEEKRNAIGRNGKGLERAIPPRSAAGAAWAAASGAGPPRKGTPRTPRTRRCSRGGAARAALRRRRHWRCRGRAWRPRRRGPRPPPSSSEATDVPSSGPTTATGHSSGSPSLPPPSPDPDLMGRAAVTQAEGSEEEEEGMEERAWRQSRDSSPSLSLSPAHTSQFSAHHARTHCWVKDCFLPSLLPPASFRLFPFFSVHPLTFARPSEADRFNA